MKNNLLKTSDWYLFIWLLAKGFEAQCIDKTNTRRCEFYFESSEELDSSIKDFWANKEVPIQNYLLALKKAKTLMNADTF